jgi:hypothetical protein
MTNQAAKWLTLAVALLVIGAVACVAIIRFTSEDTASRADDATRARAYSAMIASQARTESDSKVRVISVEPIGDQLWRIEYRVGLADNTQRACLVIDTRQFRTSKGKATSGFGHVSCAFRR